MVVCHLGLQIFGIPSRTFCTDRLIVAQETAKAGAEHLKTTCFICGQKLASDSLKRRNHIGIYILKWMQHIPETVTLINVVRAKLVLCICFTLIL